MRKMVQRLGKSNDPMQAWIDARKRRGLSHAEVQMARELGMNPAKLGKLDNHSPGAMEDSPAPKHLYSKRFGKEHPDIVPNNRRKGSPDEERKAVRREAQAASAAKRRN